MRKRRSLRSLWTLSPSAPHPPPQCWTHLRTPLSTRSNARSRLMPPSRRHPTSTCLRHPQFPKRAQVRSNALAKSQKHPHLHKNGPSVFLEAVLQLRGSKRGRAHERRAMEALSRARLKNLRLEILSRRDPWRKARTRINPHPPALLLQAPSVLPPHLCLRNLPSMKL